MSASALHERESAVMEPTTEEPPARPARPGWRLLRTNRAFLIVLAVAALIRVGTMIAYHPAFGYFLDTGGYLDAARSGVPTQIWPFGYSAFLAVLSVSGHIVTVSIAQHLLGLAIGVAVYALALRRGLRRRWAVLVAAPVLLDTRQIMLEHYVLSETLFSALMVAGFVLLLWADRPPVWMCALGGLAIASAALTRTVGEVLAVIVVVYLVARRVGWRQVAAFVLAVTIPLGAYMTWYHQSYGVYAINQWSGRYLWQRTTTFVDCSRTDFTPDEQRICPPQPRSQRLVGDMYLWAQDPDGLSNRYPGAANDPLFSSFARRAILGQPFDFVWAVAKDGLHMIEPGWEAPRRIACTTDLWTMPSGGRSAAGGPGCVPTLMKSDFESAGSGPVALRATPLNSALWAYGRTFVTPPLVLVLLALFGAVTAPVRRRWRGRDAADALLLGATGLIVLLLGLTLSVIDLRFTVPMLPLAPLGAALALSRLGRREPSSVAGEPELAAPPTGGSETTEIIPLRPQELEAAVGGRHATPGEVSPPR